VQTDRGLLNWTGHALVDVGIATLCVMSGKDDPAVLTLEDLDSAATEMERYYFSGALTSYLTCVFMNSEYVQPGSGEKKSASRKRYAERVLRAHRASTDDEATGQICAFSGEAATHLIHRGQMPLLTGQGVLNFFPEASGGLFVSGPYVTALQALPLGGRRSEGRLLVAHSDEPSLTIALARNFVEDNRRLLGLAMSGRLPDREGADEGLPREHAAWDSAKKQAKYPDAKAAFTLIASDLLDVMRGRHEAGATDTRASLHVYWLSSSGQGPSLEIFTLPSNLIRFFREVSRAATSAAWEGLLRRAWVIPNDQLKARSKDKSTTTLVGPGRSRNVALGDLLSIYADGFVDVRRARSFVRRHLLAEHRGAIERPDDCSWELTDLFLKEVLVMSPDRVERIRAFADMLAEHIAEKNDRKAFRAITFAQRPWELRNALEKTQRNEYLANQRLLFSFDDYINVFEAEENAGFADWSLIRDLICIRLIEQLHKKRWLVPDDLKSEAADEIGKEREEVIA
jgi:CRISPR-associated protein Cst1